MTKHIREKLDKISDLPTQTGNRLMRVILEEILDEIDFIKDTYQPLDEMELRPEDAIKRMEQEAEAMPNPRGVTMQDVFTYELQERIKAIKPKSKKI